MAEENPTWGYSRIRGERLNLGHQIGRTTIARILVRHGVDPAPDRPERWSTFLAAQWGAIAAADFFMVEVVTIRGLCRYHVFFVLALATRKVEIVGVARNPSGLWVKNAFRRLTDELDGFLRNSRYLILDRDPLYTTDARKVLKWSGVKAVRLPPYSPNLNGRVNFFALPPAMRRSSTIARLPRSSRAPVRPLSTGATGTCLVARQQSPAVPQGA